MRKKLATFLIFSLLSVGVLAIGFSAHAIGIRPTVDWGIDLTQTFIARTSAAISGSSDFVAKPIDKPHAWEDFAAGNLDAMPSGQRWNLLPKNDNTRVLPFLRNGYLTADDSGKITTQAYASINFGRIPASIRSEISFAYGSSGCGAALILTKTMSYTSSDAHIVDDGAVHIVFSDRKIFVGLFKNHDFYVTKKIYYPKPLSLDGTRYLVGYDIVGDVLKIYAPGIAAFQIENPRIAELSGPFLTVEPFWTSGQCHPRFHAVEAS